MPAPVVRTTVHHQGDGAPHDGTWPNSEPYCVLIGTTRLTWVQPPWTAWATRHHNHESFDICLSGNRNDHPVTDHDLALIAQACTEARDAQWLDPDAATYPHGTIYPVPPGYPTGSDPTECPGRLAIASWPDIVAHCEPGVQPIPTPGDDMPGDKDMVDVYVGPDGTWGLQYDGGIATLLGPAFYGSYFSLPASVRNDPTRRFLTICAPVDRKPNGYSIVSTRGEAYTFHTKQ